MASGRLEVEGSIDLAQFWPDGESDADTTKVKVAVGPGSFRFQPHPGAPFQVTHAFEGASVRGQAGSKPCIDKQGRVTIRLQGIDAPELHYTPVSELTGKTGRTEKQAALYKDWNFKYRQHWGETATVELEALLAQANINPLPCRVVTSVDRPNDVFDTYGRLVGEIEVALNGETLNVNHWLTANGWVFPAFYASMSAGEIQDFISRAESARKGKLGIWTHVVSTMGVFDFNLRERPKGPIEDETGAVIFPKLFRRQAAHAVNKKATMVTGAFGAYLQMKRDACFVTDDFLAQGVAAATPRFLYEFVGASGKINFAPKGLVFSEKGSKIVGPGNTEVSW